MYDSGGTVLAGKLRDADRVIEELTGLDHDRFMRSVSDIQLYLKRAKWVRPMFGDSDFHYERAARLGGL